MWTSEIAERGFSCWFLALNQLVPMELVRLLDGVVLCFFPVLLWKHIWTLHTSPLITRPLSGPNDQGMVC